MRIGERNGERRGDLDNALDDLGLEYDLDLPRFIQDLDLDREKRLYDRERERDNIGSGDFDDLRKGGSGERARGERGFVDLGLERDREREIDFLDGETDLECCLDNLGGPKDLERDLLFCERGPDLERDLTEDLIADRERE